jgi:hypothetical protein
MGTALENEHMGSICLVALGRQPNAPEVRLAMYRRYLVDNRIKLKVL